MKSKAITWVSLLIFLTLLFTVGTSKVGAPSAKAQVDLLNEEEPSAPVNPTASFPGSAPAYDSGWLPIAQGEYLTLNHYLGGVTDQYVVDLRFKSTSTSVESQGYNQRMYGGNQYYQIEPPVNGGNGFVGAYWYGLTNTSIGIHRMPGDVYADQIRVRIWVDNREDWDSGWKSVNPGGDDLQLDFSIQDGKAEDYLVYLEFKDVQGLSAVHQRYYGGISEYLPNAYGAMVGAYWYDLTDSSIRVNIRPLESIIDQIRVRIYKQPKPTYDSGWQPVAKGLTKQLVHNIGGSPDDYIVDLQFEDTSLAFAIGINQRCYGGCDLGHNDSIYRNSRMGAYWRKLTNSTIEVGREIDDDFAHNVRVRIWHFWKLSRPGYDSGWQNKVPGTHTKKFHNLGGNADDYLVYMVFKYANQNVHQLFYGGVIFGANHPAGYADDDQAGGYWNSLDSDSIDIYRGENDLHMLWYRVYIWRAPKPDFDSGWDSIIPGTGNLYIHNLQGDVGDYLVDVTCKNSGDINNNNFGGNIQRDNDRVGVYYWGLTDSQVTLVRQNEDISCLQSRLRIWRMAKPAYDSRIFTIGVNSSIDKVHNLGFSADKYFVDVTAHNAQGEHKMWYGRMDMGTPFFDDIPENAVVGYQWEGLDSKKITVNRMPDDTKAGQLRVRIWIIQPILFLPTIMK